MNIKPFENVKDQIGYCGIWCGSCVVGNGILRELTKRYEEIIKNYGLENWAPKGFNFNEFLEGIDLIRSIPLCQGCLEGGGRSDCEIRGCAVNKKLNDCSECNQSATCENSEILNYMRSGAHDAGLFIKNENVDRQNLMKKWIIELKGKWPYYILFLP
ncbi:MAG: DUF3795 domain-containing protein [Candidatus Hodarchaeota archaeon]